MEAEYRILRSYLQDYKRTHVVDIKKQDLVQLFSDLLGQSIKDEYVYLSKSQAQLLYYRTRLSAVIERLDNRVVLRYKDCSGLHIKVFENTQSLDQFIQDNSCGCDQCFEVLEKVYRITM